MPKPNILVTGGSGFVGSMLIDCLVEHNEVGDVRSLLRRKPDAGTRAGDHVIPDFDMHTDFSKCLAGVDVVIHCAGRVPQGDGNMPEAAEAYRRVNVELTATLARQAARAGVKRFVYLSSIKVNGASSEVGKPFREDDPPACPDAYAQSKLEAEQALRSVEQSGALEVCIVRPPLVYGSDAKANFDKLVRLVRSGMPIPFGAARNKRAFIARANLVDFLICCALHPKAARQTFLISDGEDLSTRELCVRISRSLGVNRMLVSVPASLMHLLLRMVGKGHLASSIFDTMQIDITKAQTRLAWQPVCSVDQQLAEMVDGYR